MKKNILGLLLLTIFISYFAVPVQSIDSSLPSEYSQDIDLDKPIIYDIIDTSDDAKVTFFGLGDAALEKGGSIELIYNGFFNEWGTDQPFFNITFKLADGSTNSTFLNQSNGNIAMTLILGFGLFQPGIITIIDWDTQDTNAIAVANTPEANPYSMNGTLEIKDAEGIHSYDYIQNPNNGNQKTYLEYDKKSGILQGWDSSFLGYYLKAKLFVEKSTDTQPFINGFPMSFMCGISGITAVVMIFLFRKQKR